MPLELCPSRNVGKDQQVVEVPQVAVGRKGLRFEHIECRTRQRPIAQGLAERILIDDATHSLVNEQVDCEAADEIMPKGFVRPVQIFRVGEFRDRDHVDQRQRLYRAGERVEVNIIDSSDIRAAIAELRAIQLEFEERLEKTRVSQV